MRRPSARTRNDTCRVHASHFRSPHLPIELEQWRSQSHHHGAAAARPWHVRGNATPEAEQRVVYRSTVLHFYHAHSTLLPVKVLLLRTARVFFFTNDGLDWHAAACVVQPQSEATHQQYRQRTIGSAPSKACLLKQVSSSRLRCFFTCTIYVQEFKALS